MILEVAARESILREPDDFRSLSVGTALTIAVLRQAVQEQNLGEVDSGGEHVWLDPDAIRAADGGRADDGEWNAGLTVMLDYAARHGWTDDRGRVRAHLTVPG